MCNALEGLTAWVCECVCEWKVGEKCVFFTILAFYLGEGGKLSAQTWDGATPWHFEPLQVGGGPVGYWVCVLWAFQPAVDSQVGKWTPGGVESKGELGPVLFA